MAGQEKTEHFNDPVFIEEQNHLSKLYDKLEEMRDKLEKELQDISEKAADEKKTQSEDLRLNFNDDSEAQETLIEFEIMSQAVAQMNIASDSVASKLSSVRQLLPRPYFARITVQFEEDEDPEDFYIGSTALSDENHDQMIVDWRSPIAEVYYNHENGHTFYTVDDRKIPVDLSLRRQFDITGRVLNSYFDTKIAIEDPMLLRSLSRKRTDKMQSITETIQKEQNTVIRYPDVPALLVNGIAGSGKTSVLLQRIAYLFYRKRKNLRPEQIYLITLNPVFQQYIDNVLPEMGEQNPNSLTWGEFLDTQGIHHHGDGDLTDVESLRKIDRELSSFRLTEDDFRGITQKGTKVLSKKQIAEIVGSHSNIETGIRLIQISVDELEDAAKKNAIEIERHKKDDERSENLEDKPARSGAASEKQIENQYGGAIQAIRSFRWLDIDRIGKRFLKKDDLTDAEWLYLKMALTGLCDRNAKYVMIDEVQDYSEAQMMVFLKYFKNARFMMLGDEFQSIHDGNISFAEIKELFSKNGKEVTELPLLTSYRSSPEITALFTQLLPKEIRVQTSSVQRPGVEPDVREFKDHKTYVAELKKAVRENRTDDTLTAVVCRDWTQVNRMKQLLGEDTPQVIRENEMLPEHGIVLLELRLAKGLEFDTVILPDATDRNYPNEMLSRHKLYTALSRATEKLVVFADGNLTELLKKD